ncbi:MAG: Mrp/NBP35 family ATP-binding protein [Ruminococcaceae bacterium]|nr:Mrp/NBP35 family ATP-binding protein [Oscillospiraceae bacterium]
MDTCNHDCANCGTPCEEQQIPVEECTHDCSTCSANCASRGSSPEDFRVQLHEMSSVKKVIGVVSGKGGVGKSLVSALMAVTMMRRGHRTAILDADVTGPSVPNMFGLKGVAYGDEHGIIPVATKMGIDVISSNLLLEDAGAPIVWRGAMIANLVQQFWSQVIWKDVDFMFVDMPPGTGDVPLTVFQSLPVDGIIVVTSPQDMVSMIVGKAVRMAELMNIPIIGMVENMSYLTCPDCGKEIRPYGDSHIDSIADAHGLKVLAKLPINPEFAKLCDQGLVELFEGDFLEAAADAVEQL